jgi:lipoprotein-anchoring transpeptidase ErfK/SrfK
MSTALTVVLVAAALVVGALGGLALSGGLNGAGKPAAAPNTSPAPTTTTVPTTTTTSKAQAAAQLLAAVQLVPPSGATHQSPSTVVSVSAPAGARLVDVRVHPSSGGATLTGALDAQRDIWKATGQLLPGTAYLVSYEVQGAGGLVAYGSANFTTAPPKVVVSVDSLFPSSGIVVGVGQPIVIYFSHPVDTYAAQQAVLSRLHLAMTKPVPGGWHWFSSVELHFRPAHYWPVGEQVQLTGDLTGWRVGGGAWGEGRLSTSFVVGASHISVVNVATHEMTVYDNGDAIYKWPISAGAPNWPTQDGVHIVLDRNSEVHMISSSVGIPVKSPGGYNEEVYWDVHISSSGEYIHAAPWSLSQQGYVNVSHGCVNLSPQRAETFFRFSRAGDIVQVVNSSRSAVMGDQGVMDWSFPTSTVLWTTAKVGPLASTVGTSTTTSEPPPAGAPYSPTTLPPAAPAP